MSGITECCQKKFLNTTGIRLTSPFPRNVLLIVVYVSFFTPTTCADVRSSFDRLGPELSTEREFFSASGPLNSLVTKADGTPIHGTIPQPVVQPDVYRRSSNLEYLLKTSPTSKKQHCAMLRAMNSSSEDAEYKNNTLSHTVEMTAEAAGSIDSTGQSLAVTRHMPIDPTADIVEENNVASCLKNNGHLTTFIRSNAVYIAYSSRKHIADRSTSMTCTVIMTTAVEKRLKLAMRTKAVGICYRRNYLTVSDGQTQTVVWSHSQCKKKRALKFTSAGNKVTVKFHVMETSKRYFIKISTAAVSATLELVRLSPTQGYVQTPGNNEWETYLDLMDTWQQIFAPTDHVTLLSISRFSVQRWSGKCDDVVEVYAGGRAKENRVWAVCGTSPPLPEVLYARCIHVHFKTNAKNQYAGFKLQYTFHRILHLPSRGKDGLWNCSVPEWPRFRIHFLCNLNWECQGGEDEADCSYTGHCGEGYLTLDNRCYSYGTTNGYVCWEEVNLKCVARGGHLASLNTPREWKVITDFVKGRQTPKHVFVGMKSASTVLPTWSVKYNDVCHECHDTEQFACGTDFSV